MKGKGGGQARVQRRIEEGLKYRWNEMIIAVRSKAKASITKQLTLKYEG